MDTVEFVTYVLDGIQPAVSTDVLTSCLETFNYLGNSPATKSAGLTSCSLHTGYVQLPVIVHRPSFPIVVN